MNAPFKCKPAWIAQTGLLSVGFWEPLYFLKYRGGGGTDVEEQYALAHSDESLDGLAAAGINLVWIHFFKGFGLEFEKEEMERSRDYIARAHRRGLRVAAYVTLGSLTPETLLAEEPDAQNWLQVNQDGQPPSCQISFQSFRVRPCYNAEGYQRYMEKVCTHAVDCGADMLHFDNIGYNAEPDTCHCPVCVASFREMLREKYGSQSEATRRAGLARFGHTAFQHVRPPVYNRWNQAINQRRIQVPHQQEWVLFKVRSLTRCLARMSRCIERRNPECAVEANLFKAFGENTEWLHGICYSEQLPLLDYAFSEEPHKPGVINRHGAAISRARTFKTGRAFDVAVQVYNQGRTEADLELSLAENMAFNAKGLGHFGVPLEGYWAPGQAHRAESDPHARLVKAYMDFYRARRQDLFLNTRTLAHVAVYRDTTSLAFNSVETHVTQLNVEQALLENNIPFDLVYPNHLDDLAKYRALILPNAECLSDEIAGKILRYAEGGGGVLAAEETGVYDEWRRRRTRNALAPLFGAAWDGAGSGVPLPAGPAVPGVPLPAGPAVPLRANFGAGKAAWLPRLEPLEQPSTAPEVWYVFNEYWAPPRNTPELLDALAWLAGEMPWSVRASAGRPLAEGLQTPSGATVLHVLNLDVSQPVLGLEADVYFERAPQQVMPLAPTWSYEPLPFQYDEARKRVLFRFEELKRYALFAIT